jgi:hypothetical protein
MGRAPSFMGNVGTIQKPQNHHHQNHGQSPKKNGESPNLFLVPCRTPFSPHEANYVKA